MNTVKARGTRVLWLLFAVGLLVVPSDAIRLHAQDRAALAAIQEPTPPATSSQQTQNQQQDQHQQQEQQQADKSVRPTKPDQGQSTPGDKTDDTDEVKITPRQAEELFHSVDEILEFDSKETGMPIKHGIKRKLIGRDQVVSYLTKHVDDEDTKRLRRSELVLKKFGLLPRQFDLQTFLVALLREEIAGYYDPKTKTVNLLDWVPMAEQEPVMAHELTHALQDQTIGMLKWMKKGDRDLAEMKKDPTPTDIENDEIDSAREAVIEGQAQAISFQYAIAPTGRSIANAPEIVDTMVEETLTGSANTKVFNEAPVFMKESLTFPYSYGLLFVVKVLQKSGKEKAFAGVLHDPPHTTRQIMQPETYLSGERIPAMHVPDFKQDFKDYQKFDVGAMGEFDVAVLTEQYEGKAASKRMYPEWRGGYYYAARPKANSTAPLGLLYVSRWSSAEKAAEFAGIYARSLKTRYTQLSEIDAALRTTEELKSSEPLTGRHAWTTEEGTIVIEERGDTVLVSESLDSATTSAIEREVFGAEALVANPARSN